MTLFTCQCGSTRFVELLSFMTNGQVAPFQYGKDDGQTRQIQCVKCQTRYRHAPGESVAWKEVTD